MKVTILFSLFYIMSLLPKNLNAQANAESRRQEQQQQEQRKEQKQQLQEQRRQQQQEQKRQQKEQQEQQKRGEQQLQCRFHSDKCRENCWRKCETLFRSPQLIQCEKGEWSEGKCDQYKSPQLKQCEESYKRCAMGCPPCP